MHTLRRLAFQNTILVLSTLLFLAGSAPVAALSKDQIGAFNSNINYFNTEVDCGGISNGTSTTTTTSLTGSDNMQQAYNYFLSKGLNAIGSSAAVGNLMEESHLDPTIVQSPPGGDSKDPSWITASAYPLTGWGIAQWTPGAKIIGIAQNLHVSGPIYELATQLDIVWAEMTGSAPTGFQNVAAGLKQQTDLGAATSYFQVHFESGTNYDARFAQAQIVYNKYGASGQVSTTPTTTTPLSNTTPTQCNSTLSNVTAGNGKDIIWLESGPSAEFDGVCDGCRDPKSGITDYWISGQCSQASLAEILNAYDRGNALKNVTYNGQSVAPSTGGTYYKTIDVERLSYKAGVWDGAFLFKPSPYASWQTEAAMFHMNLAYYDSDGTANKDNVITASEDNLKKMIAIANAGTPVITSAPNHWLVIWGGDANDVWLLDSSGNDETWAPASTKDSINISKQPYHVHEVTHAEFLKGLAGFANYWGGDPNGQNPQPIAVVLTPQSTTTTTPL